MSWPEAKLSESVPRRPNRRGLYTEWLAPRQTHYVPMPDNPSAFKQVMAILSKDPELQPDIVGHRMVHGGAAFGQSAMVTPEVMKNLEGTKHMAPIHNPPAISMVHACRELYPGLPQVVVFDTGFHSTIPEYAYTYALPASIRRSLGIRKYGFHGISHQYVASEAARLMGIPMKSLNAVSCHLGSGGASLCAISHGMSVDNTMGFSPLQGLIMSTRCGDLDPAITLQMLTRLNGDPDNVETLLNRRSGVLGMSGTSADIRDVLDRTSNDYNATRNDLAAQAYIWRIKKYLGSYLAVVGNPRAVIFTDTIGETVPSVREAVCMNMEAFGIRIDRAKNSAVEELPADIATGDSRVRLLVIATNEELAIARETYTFAGRNTNDETEKEKAR